MKHSQSAFTLIELLTVIAIIGILAATILRSITDARNQGIDARIQSEMDAIIKRASIENAGVPDYDTVCGTNSATQSTVIAELITSINNFASSTVTCNSGPAAYAVSAPMVSGGHWCIDSLGVKKEISNALTSGQLSCP